MAQFQGVDSTAVLSYGAPMYGHLYQDSIPSNETISVASADTWYGWTTATAGVLQGVTADTSDATADHLTIPAGGAGDYMVIMKVDGFPATNEIFEWSVHVDGSQKVQLTALSYNPTGDAGAQASVASGIIALADAEEVSLRVQNLSSTGDYQLRSAQLAIYRVST
jgi:hypothetical protein